MKTIYVILAILVLVLLIGWGKSEDIISNDEAEQQARADLQSSYQRRADLIPNLVAIVQGSASYESGVLEAVTKARASVGQINISPEMFNDPEQLAAFQAAQGELSGALTRLLAVVENYPDLKANQGFLRLQDQYEGTENRINVARRDWNSSVRNFNQSIRGLVGGSVNGLVFEYERRIAFEAQEGAENAPVINFD